MLRSLIEGNPKSHLSYISLLGRVVSGVKQSSNFVEIVPILLHTHTHTCIFFFPAKWEAKSVTLSSGGGDTLGGLKRLVMVKSTGLYDPQRSLMFKVHEP